LSYTKIQRLKKELDRAIAENDFELALESVNDMIKLDHDNDQYWNSRGVILSKLGKVEDALQAFDQALELNQGESRIWYSKGCVLMDSGKPRPALACFYKSLDIEPEFEKARNRFTRCLDDLVLLNQSKNVGPSEEEEEVEEEEEEEEAAPEISEPKAVKKRGTYLDDDMFGVEIQEEEEEEEEEMDLDEIEEEWDEEEEEEEEWIEEEEEEDDEEEEMESIKCRCGENIWIETNKRPYRFKCRKCGRQGTLN
jgi:tetratricopeptide (TPR) repeat protein